MRRSQGRLAVPAFGNRRRIFFWTLLFIGGKKMVGIWLGGSVPPPEMLERINPAV